MERKNAWNTYDGKELRRLAEVTEDYKRFLSEAKTERECAALAVKMAEKKGYRSLEAIQKEGRTLRAGDKVYAVHKKKLVVLYYMGERTMEEGLNILGAHIDSPRLDLKQNPLYEEGEMALLDSRESRVAPYIRQGESTGKRMPQIRNPITRHEAYQSLC